MEQTFILPWPISVNRAFKNQGKARALVGEAKKWITHAGWLLKEQKVQRFKGPVQLRIELCPHHSTPYDVSNYIKVLEDTLVSNGIIEGDDNRTVKRVISEEGQGFQGARVTVSEWVSGV